MTRYTVPPQAQRAAQLVREQVPRPETEPHTWCSPQDGERLKGLHWPLRWDVRLEDCSVGLCCPLGMLPGAPAMTPVPDHAPFCGLTREEVGAFVCWWDTLEDFEAAVEAVWGPLA